MDVAPLRRRAAEVGGRVRFVTRFVDEAEIPAIFRRADLVVLPYLDAEHSGVLYTGLAFGKPLVLSAVGGFPEVAATGAARLVPPGDVGALADALAELVGDEAARAELGAAAARAAAGPFSWDEAARRHPRPLPRADRGPLVTTFAAILFWVSAGLLVYTHLGYPLVAAGPAPGVVSRMTRALAPDNLETTCGGGAADGLPDRPRLRRGGGDRGQGRQRARARLPARAAAGDRRLRRLHRRHRRARPRGRRRPRPRAARRRQGRRAQRRRRAGERRAARLLRRQQRLGAGRAAPAWSAPSPTRAVGYVCGQVRFVDAGGDNLEGAYWRYEMAVREMESALAGVTAGNGAIYAVRRDAYLAARALRQPRPQLPLRARQARPALALRARRPGPRRRWSRRWRASSPANGG